MSWEATAWAKKQRCGSPSTKAVLLCLADAMHPHTKLCCPSHETLAYECEMTERSIQTHIAKLVELGLIEVEPRYENGRRFSNAYVFPKLSLPEDFSDSESVPENSGTVPENQRSLPETERKPTGSQLPEHIEPKREPKNNILSAEQEKAFAEWWKVYPRKSAKDAARKAYKAALKKTDQHTLKAKAEAYAAQQARLGTEQRFIAYPATWLNRGSWEDEELNDPTAEQKPSNRYQRIAAQYQAAE